MPSRLAIAHRNEVARIRAAVALAAQLAFDDVPSIDQRYMADFLEQILPVVLAGQSNAVALTDAYMAEYLTAQGIPRDVRGLDPADFGRGVAAEKVYARPFVQTWTKQRDGMDPDAARNYGRHVAGQLANTDVQLASRGAAREWMRSETRIVGYRRVIGPAACNYCRTASTQRYRSDQLMPLHSSCGCGVEPETGLARSEPIIGTEDPGQIIDLKVVEHGELGPVLYDADHTFDTAA